MQKYAIIILSASALAGFGSGFFFYHIPHGRLHQLYASVGIAWENVRAYASDRDEEPPATEVQVLPPSEPGPMRAPILIYHSVAPHYAGETEQVKRFDVEPVMFTRQMQYLKEQGYTVVSLGALVDAIQGKDRLPDKPVVLTFDDGWENQYLHAFPVLKEYGYNATFFVFTNAIGHRHFLTWEEVRDLAATGMAIGDHTKSHPYLHKITDDAQIRDEVLGSRDILQEHLGRTVDLFAYPFGRPSDQVIKVLKENGYRTARTDGWRGVVNGPEDLYTLKAVEVGDSLESLVHILESEK